MKSIFFENENLTPSERLAGSKKSEGGKNNWSDHKSMVTVWLIVLFALWVVLTTALAVTAGHSKSRKTLQPPVIAARSYSLTPQTYIRKMLQIPPP